MFKRFAISILIPGMPLEPETLATRSLGGAESAGLYMARALAREGASVSVFCTTCHVWADETGVCYLPLDAWSAYVRETPHDVCIVQRTIDSFAQCTSARLNLLWCHESALRRNRDAFRGHLWNVDRAIVLSRYMLEQYKQAYGLEDDAFFVSRNGIDVEALDTLAAAGVKRDARKLVFASRPERGLDVLLRHIMPRLLSRKADLRLYLATYDQPAGQFRELYAECAELAARLGDRVVQLGALSKSELYRHYLSARVYVYPTPSPSLANCREVSCISAMECQGAGLPVVTTALGALPETIAPGAGLLIGADPSDPAQLSAYVEQFVDGVLTFVNDERAWSSANECALARGRELDWSRVATEWLAEFERLIRARNDSPARLVRHFVRNGDVVSAERVRASIGVGRDDSGPYGGPDLVQLLTPWADGDESRLRDLRNWLAAHKRRISTVLDYGCGGGARTIDLARRLDHVRIHGVDCSTALIDTANGSAGRLRVAERATFSVWADEAAESIARVANPVGERFDCALIQDVLVRVPEPWAVIERVEGQVRRGGRIHLTVPCGAWDLGWSRSGAPRSQIWHMDSHDIADMIGSKPDVSVDYLGAGNDPVTGEPLGWWIATYTVDHRPIPAIDWDRHLWLQRPRQSLSVAIIAGPESQETLAWSLRSIHDLADEIVIVDCGMSKEARRLASEFSARLIAAADPNAEGFECARNAALAACVGDWCLWIDTDEKLVDARTLARYLRDNVYHSYQLTHHRFACNAKSRSEAAVRLFRRRPYGGRVVRFWGAFHETAELGVDEGAGPNMVLPDVHVASVGSLDVGRRQARISLNRRLLELDRVRYPERLKQKLFIMRDNMQAVREALNRDGARIDGEIRARCRETIELHQNYFLGKGNVGASDALAPLPKTFPSSKFRERGRYGPNQL